MRVLAIGATGFIGPHVVRLLIEQGHDVAVLHRGRTSAELTGVRHVFGDRNALADVVPEVAEIRPEVVLDVVPYTERQAEGLVGAFRGLARRVVALSSADVYRNYDGFRGAATAPPDPTPLSEDAPLRETRYPYRGSGLPLDGADDYDKILVERVVLGDPDLPGTVLRLPAVYGPGDRQRRVRPYLRLMDAGRDAVPLSEEQSGWRWTRGYVGNVAAAVALAVTDERAAGHVYNVGEEPAPTEREWVERIGAAARWQGEVVAVPAEPVPTGLRQPFDFRYDLATDTSRLRHQLGYAEPVDPQDALQRTVEWERSETDESDPPDAVADR
ncbi:NAD-dependent epimerase/dehydratase family protein [Rubrivirga sp.]|uniref:NAD-dependent epimerase/dehydratase family protein n=1 Tax=Rubrivirga sp. TaxID=1885344 RepID=UPI003B529225